MWCRDAYAMAPWGGGKLPPLPVGTLPPPIPGDAATFTFTSRQVARPWAYLSWAGGYPPPAYPGGGILAHADAAAGVVDIRAWWPDAALLQVVRIGPDGSRTPVRGAYPLVISGATRRNRCLNPSVEVGLNGYVPETGSPTLSAVPDAAAPSGSTVLRLTRAAAGSSGVIVPTTMTAFTTGATFTVAFAIRASAQPTAVTVSIDWLNSVGAVAATTSATLSADERAMAVGAFVRVVKTMTAPVVAVDGTLKIVAAGMPAGGTVDLDAVIVESAVTDGSYVDGDRFCGTWLGAVGLSASVIAAPQHVLDAESPLDVQLTYEVAYQAVTGGAVVSTPPVLLPGDRGSWISHPARPGQSLQVDLATVPRLERSVAQGVFLPLGAQRPVVVSAARRQAPVTTLSFVALSYAQRDALLDLLADAQPLLLRFPREYGYNAPLWLAFGRVTEDRGEHKAFHDTMILEAEATEVNAPAVVV